MESLYSPLNLIVAIVGVYIAWLSYKAMRNSPNKAEKGELQVPETENIPKVEPGTEPSIAWEDQAKELIELNRKWHSLRFEKKYESRYHCWQVHDEATKRPTLLFCFEGRPPKEVSDSLRKACAELPEVREMNWDDIRKIVAFKEKSEDSLPEELRKDDSILCVTEDSLLGELVDFTPYFREIKERIKKPISEADHVDLTIERAYVPSLYESEREKGKVGTETVDDLLWNWVQERGMRQIALLGEYGMGKSTASLLFTHRLITAHHENNNPSGRIPLLIELRGKAPRNLEPNELLTLFGNRYNILGRALEKLLVAGKLILIFEGFDEMEMVGARDARLAHFRTLWKLCYPKAKILITGRPNLFLDTHEKERALRTTESSILLPFCEAVTLAPFNKGQIVKTLGKMMKEEKARNEIIQRVGASEGFKEIASRPSTLHQISLIWRKYKMGEQGEGITNALVMRRFIEYSYDRQAEKDRKAHNTFMNLNKSERSFFMSGIAYRMGREKQTNQIRMAELNEEIARLYKTMPDAISTEDIDDPRDPLRKRLEGRKSVLEDIQTEVRTCGLLVEDTSSPGCFKFAHKSYMEYLFSETMAESLKAIPLKPLEKARLDAIVGESHYEVNHLYEHRECMAYIADLLVEEKGSDEERARNLYCLLQAGRGSLMDKLTDIWGLAIWNSLSPKAFLRLIKINEVTDTWGSQWLTEGRLGRKLSKWLSQYAEGFSARSAYIHIGLLKGVHHQALIEQGNDWLARRILREILILKLKKDSGLFSGLNLRGIHLKNRSFHHLHLEQANLTGAKLINIRTELFLARESNCEGAKMELTTNRLDFEFANLVNATLNVKNAESTSFDGANLRGVALQGESKLVNWYCANLIEADISGFVWDESLDSGDIDSICIAGTLYNCKLPPGMESKIREKHPELFTAPVNTAEEQKEVASDLQE